MSGVESVTVAELSSYFLSSNSDQWYKGVDEFRIRPDKKYFSLIIELYQDDEYLEINKYLEDLIC